jgi:hypothetical protein
MCNDLAQKKMKGTKACLLGIVEGQEQNDFFFKKISVQGLIRVIIDEARLWKQAGAKISLVEQYGGAPFDPG